VKRSTISLALLALLLCADLHRVFHIPFQQVRYLESGNSVEQEIKPPYSTVP